MDGKFKEEEIVYSKENIYNMINFLNHGNTCATMTNTTNCSGCPFRNEINNVCYLNLIATNIPKKYRKTRRVQNMKNSQLNEEILIVKATAAKLFEEMRLKNVDIEKCNYPKILPKPKTFEKEIMKMESEEKPKHTKLITAFLNAEDKKFTRNKNNKLEQYKNKFEKALENLSCKMDEIDEYIIEGYSNKVPSLDELIFDVYAIDFEEYDYLYNEEEK